jgi:cyanate lyase
MGPPRNVALTDEVCAAVEKSDLSHDEIARRAGITLAAFRSKLYGQRPWKLGDLAGVAAALGVPAGPWLNMVRLGDLVNR